MNQRQMCHSLEWVLSWLMNRAAKWDFFRQIPKRVACFDQCNVSQDDHIWIYFFSLCFVQCLFDGICCPVAMPWFIHSGWLQRVTVLFHVTRPVTILLPILDACLNLENDIGCNSWITRVPTQSNISDDPSRLIADSMFTWWRLCAWWCCLYGNLDDFWLPKLAKLEQGEANDQRCHAQLDKMCACNLRGSSAHGSSVHNLKKQTTGKRAKL